MYFHSDHSQNKPGFKLEYQGREATEHTVLGQSWSQVLVLRMGERGWAAILLNSSHKDLIQMSGKVLQEDHA